MLCIGFHTIHSSNGKTCAPHMQMQPWPNINNNDNLNNIRSRGRVIGLDEEIVKWHRLTIRRRTQVSMQKGIHHVTCIVPQLCAHSILTFRLPPPLNTYMGEKTQKTLITLDWEYAPRLSVWKQMQTRRVQAAAVAGWAAAVVSANYLEK